MNQQGLLADKKREGRCSGDHLFFTVCEVHFSGFIRNEENIMYAKKVLHQSHHVLPLQVSLPLRDK